VLYYPTVGKRKSIQSTFKDTFTGKRIPKGTKVSFMEEENGFYKFNFPIKVRVGFSMIRYILVILI
jgi:hypothetical protein